MRVSGLYFVPAEPHTTNALANVVNRLKQAFRNPTNIGRWSLDHTLFRSIPAPEDTTPPRLQHVLFLSHLPGKTYITITDPAAPLPNPNDPASAAEPGREVTIGIGREQTETFLRLLMGKMNALWAMRAHLVVKEGVVYEIGEFTVRVGEVRTAANPSMVKGVAISIEMAVERDEDEGDSNSQNQLRGPTEGQIQATHELIRAMWKDFGIDGAKEAMSSPVRVRPGEEEFAEISMWCSVMRLRT